MTNIKNTPQYLDRDLDERLIPNTAMRYGLNVRVLSSNADDAGALENILGTTEIDPNLTEDTYTCIGMVSHEEKNDLYIFLFAENEDNHAILKYNSVLGNIRLVLQNSVLRFRKNKFVHSGACITAQNEDTLLYYTDGVEQPRKFNVHKAILHTSGDTANGYPTELSSGTFEERLKYVSLAKEPPIAAPTFEFGTDTSKTRNNLDETLFQFRYRYIYDDGEYSAYSQASKIAYTDDQISNDSFDEQNPNYNNNYIKITVDNGLQTVDRIEIIARNGNLGEWKTIKELDNNSNIASQSFRFYNDGLYNVADPAETNKLFDAVPLRAETIDILNNRLFLANTVDGYDQPKVVYSSGRNIAGQISFSTIPHYKSRAGFTQFQNDITVVGFAKNVQIGAAGFRSGIPIITTNVINFANAPTPQEGRKYMVNWLLDAKVSLFTGLFGGTETVDRWREYFTVSYTAQNGDTINDVMDAMAANLQGTIQNDVRIISASRSGNGIVIKSYLRNPSLVPSGAVFDSRRLSYDTQFTSFVYDSANLGESTYKSGAYHPIGIVLYDQYGRSTTVLKPKDNEVYVKNFSERANNPLAQYELLGAANIDLRIDGTPPEWARFWSPLYAGNSSDSRESLLEYPIAKAFRDKNSGLAADNKKVYLSLNNFKGKETSYREQKGAEIDYVGLEDDAGNFQPGDRVRVISYYDYQLGERVYADSTLDFKVVGYEFLQADADTNPIYNSSSDFQTTGWFLILENPDIDGFNASDVANATQNYWFYDTGTSSDSESAVIQIYRPQRFQDSENVPYFETGDLFPIANAGTANASFRGELRNQGENVSYTIDSTDTTEGIIYLDLASTIIPQIVNGDLMSAVDGGTTRNIVVTNVAFIPAEGKWGVYTEDSIVGISTGTLTLTSETAAVRLDDGDTWFKPRLLYNGSGAVANQFIDMVEDYYLNDFFVSNSWSRGRANAYSPESKQEFRKATVWFSEPFFTDTYTNGFSSYNLSLAPYKDLDRSYGGVFKIRKRGTSLITYQENKVSNIPISRQIIESADGGRTLALSSNLFGDQTTYDGDWGICQNPESFAQMGSTHYFCDIKRGKVLRLANNGLTPISDYGMNNFFDERSRELLSVSSTIDIRGGYDREYGEYVLNFPSVQLFNFTISDRDIPGVFNMNFSLPNSSEDANNIYLNADVVGVQNPPEKVYGNETRNWSQICENWGEWGYVYLDLDDYKETGKVFVFTNLANSISTAYETLVKIPTSNGDYYAQATINFRTGVVTIPKAQDCGGFDLDITASTATTPYTLGFYEDANRWQTFYSYQPEYMGGISSQFLSFNGGSLWKHNDNATRNNFYGVQYDSEIEIYFNAMPSVVKAFKSMWLEGSTSWDVTALETNLNATTLAASDFDEREGFFYQSIPFATTGSTTGNIVPIGTISDITSNTITINGLSLAGSGLAVNDNLYDESQNLIGTITAFPQDGQITLSTVVGLTIGGYVYVQKPASTSGDRIRGYYAKAYMTNDSTSGIELFAVNTDMYESKPILTQ